MPRYPLAGVTEFTKLLDTPAAYSGQAGKVPAVNTGETALEYAERMAGVKVRKNTQMPILGTRPQLNFIEGAAIGLNLADNPPDDEIDITVSAKYPTRFMTLIPDDAVLPAANPAALASVDGVNFSYECLDFDQATEESAYWEWYLSPDYLSENIVVDIYWIATPAAGDVKFGFSVLGREKGETWDSALGTERTVVQPTGGAGVLNKARITTFSPGWAAGDVLLFKLARKAADAADTLADDARMVKVVVSYTGQFAQAFYPLPEAVDITSLCGAVAAWRTVDVSDYVPVGATGVILHFTGASGRNIGARKKGSTDNRTQTGRDHCWAPTGLNESLQLEVYRGNAGTSVYLVAYTGTGVVFFDNAYTKALTPAAFENIDLSVECPGAIGIIYERTSGTIQWALRENGSSDDRPATSYHAWGVIGCDASQLINSKVNGGDTLYVVGYVYQGAVFKTNGVDKTPSVSDAWEEKDCSVEAPSGIMLFFEQYSANNSAYVCGYKKRGSTEEIIQDAIHCIPMVACDSGQKVEIYEDTLIFQTAHLIGYATWAGA